MNKIKSFLAMLLVICLVFSVFPIMPQAASEPVVVIAASDYQNTNGGLFSSGASTDAYAILDRIQDDYATADAFLFGGDYYAHSTNTTTESTNGKNQLDGEIVDALYPDMADEKQIYIQGNHDADSLTTNGTLATSGAHDTDSYGVYVINEKDYMWYNDSQSTIQNTAASLETYLNTKLDEGYSKPIFILSHLPLHYTNRTKNEGDGKYAKYIYDVLDEAGKNDLNIIFLYGHNHSTAYDSYLGNGSVYLAEGDSISVANEGSTSSYFTDTLTFTYMNYGFVGYIGSSDADSELTMTVFEITDSNVSIHRYDANGTHDLKSAGGTTQLPSGLSANSTVYASGQTIELTTPVEKVSLTQNGVTVTAPGLKSMTVTKVASPEYNSNLYAAYASYDITTEGYTQGDTATVSIELDTADGFDTSKSVVLIDKEKGTKTEKEIVEGTVTFTTNHFSTYDIAQYNSVEIEVEVSGSNETEGTIWRQVTSMTEGKKYMLVVYGDNASGVSNFAVNSNAGGTAVTVQTDTTGAYIENSDMALAWTATSDSGKHTLSNVSTGQYLYISGYPSGTGSVNVAVTDSVTSGTNYSNWMMGSTGSGETSLSVSRGDSSNHYPIRWSNGGQEFLAYTSSQTDKHDNWVALFELTSEGESGSGSNVETSGGDWVTITEPTGGTTTYTYTQATSITAGEEYVIVGNGHDVALMDNNGSMGSQSVTISGDTMTSTTELTEWTFSGSSSGTIYNGTHYLRYSNGFSLNANQSTNLSFTDNGSNFRIWRNSNWGTDYSFYYNGSSWTRSNSTQYVRLYQLTDTTTTGGTAGLYGKIEGELVYNVASGTSAEDAIDAVKAGITIKYATASDYSDEATFSDDGEGMTWTLDESYGDGTTPGEYAVTISYNGIKLGTAKVVVPETTTEKWYVSIDSDSGTVRQNAKATATTGSKLTVTKADGTTETVNVTLDMLRDAEGNSVSTTEAGTITGLKVYYMGHVICDNYTLTVREIVQNDYPEYPDEGSINVNKTATGVDFQSTGVAKVELSAAGVPVKKGADVIVMLDTSSSMNRGANTNSNVDAPNRRIDFMQTAVAGLIEQFQEPGDDGELLDIRMAIAEFNGYEFISSAEHPSDSTQQTATNVAEVFTGDGSKTADAFVQASSISDPVAFAANIGAHSGTNYDYAFDTIYRLGASIQAANEETGEARDLFVIFMSDGAPYAYNYYGSGTTDSWDAYLNGTLDVSELEGNIDFYRTDGKHWMAEAVKGATTSYYDVIDPAINDNDALSTLVSTQASDKGSYFVQVPGLGAEVHSIGFCVYDDAQSGGTVTAETAKTVLSNVASLDENGSPMYHYTDSGEGLSEAFTDIGSDIAYAATNAYFVDTMGANYNLQLENTVTRYNEDGTVDEVITLSESPQIVVQEYDIYTRADYEAGTITEDRIGDRKTDDAGNYISTVKETVTFNESGTEAYSNGDTTNNILIDGVICADTFWYNTTGNAVLIDVDGDQTAEYSLAPETFYWKIGTVTNKEIALSYYVYLTGSMEGERAAGSYPTNESAVLYYKNWLGHDAHKDTVSPVLAWESANVSYAFYLVDENGNIIVNQTTGQTGSFANKIAVTNPVVYEEVYLNDETQVKSINVASLGVLPEGYVLYDEASTYTIEIDSDSTGSWSIGKNSSLVNSTYVTGYRGNEYSNTLNVDENGYDYTHTTVWFAVVFKIGTLPDSVVIDYGLPVNINVLGNDMFGDYGTLAAVGNTTINNNTEALDADYASSKDTQYGNVAVIDGKVKYTPDTSNAMLMSTVDTFNYAVNYTGPANAGYYYGNVTVIPATMVYYEENFVSFTDSTAATDSYGKWTDVGIIDSDAVQAEDRPGTSSLTSYDTNNVYGYDAAYSDFTQYSLGGAKKVTVDVATGKPSTAPTATFKFTGTGFDVISLTDYDSGLIVVTVKDENGTVKARKTVDNYYGYTYSETDGWVVDTTSTDTIWQVPVIKIQGLAYATYDVTIQVAYMSSADHRADGSYSFRLDAIRVYDQAIEDETAIKAYIADDEYDPLRLTLRDLLVDEGTLSVETGTGVVFIDGIDDNYAVATYANQGPNNEVYLDYGQGISFKLQTAVKPESVQLGVKLADGDSATLMKGDSEFVTVSTATDMYYKLNLSWKETTDGYESEVITLSNASDTGIISLTNLKYTYEYVEPVTSSYSLRAVVNEETANEGIALMRALYMPPEVFEPVYVSTQWKAGKVNKNSILTVTTSEDVQYISVNGQIIDKYMTVPEISFENWNFSISFKRVWVYSEKIKEAGTYEYDVIYYNEEDVASEVENTELFVTENVKKEKQYGKKDR